MDAFACTLLHGDVQCYTRMQMCTKCPVCLQTETRLQVHGWRHHAGQYLRDTEAAQATGAALAAVNKQLRAEVQGLAAQVDSSDQLAGGIGGATATARTKGAQYKSRQDLADELETVKADLAAARRSAANGELSANAWTKCALSHACNTKTRLAPQLLADSSARPLVESSKELTREVR